MAKRFKKKKASQHHGPVSGTRFKVSLSNVWMPLLLATVTFLIYWPSLKSDFVYDARLEILNEGFITSLSNLPAVLSLKVLGMSLMLGSRPGQMLYLMLNAAAWGKEPFGYHLSSNLLHAANVALLFVLLRRLIATEATGLDRSETLKAQFAAAVVALIFGLHPLAVESVAEVSYSSSLLVAFLTLLALLMATAFRPENIRSALLTGGVGTLCAFASAASKESGVTTVLLLVVYWFLFRRREAKEPWHLFLGAAAIVTGAFLTARFALAPPIPPGPVAVGYLGGSLSQVFLIEPRLWVFMMGKLLWPVQLSADYTPVEILGPSTPVALVILAVVVLLQGWLACKSRMGALGVAIYWLGLATVSNFIVIYHPVADRYYYLPLAGVAMQLLALLLMTLRSYHGFWLVVMSLLIALLPLAFLTVKREGVFANEFSLWSDTVQVSPLSAVAHSSLAAALLQKGQLDEAIDQFQKVLKVNPDFAEGHNNLGIALFQKGRTDEAMAHFQEALRLKPDYSDAQFNLAKAKDMIQQGAAHK